MSIAIWRRGMPTKSPDSPNRAEQCISCGRSVRLGPSKFDRTRKTGNWTWTHKWTKIIVGSDGDAKKCDAKTMLLAMDWSNLLGCYPTGPVLTSHRLVYAHSIMCYSYTSGSFFGHGTTLRCPLHVSTGRVSSCLVPWDIIFDNGPVRSAPDSSNPCCLLRSAGEHTTRAR